MIVRQLSSTGFGWLNTQDDIAQHLETGAPIHAERGFNDSIGKPGKLLDVTTVGADTYCLSGKAYKALREFLDASGVKVASVNGDFSEYYALSVPVRDALLSDETEFRRLGLDNRIVGIRRPVFTPGEVRPFFQVALPSGKVDGNVFITDEVATAIVEKKLKGCSSVRVWQG